MMAYFVKIHFFLIVPSASPLCNGVIDPALGFGIPDNGATDPKEHLDRAVTDLENHEPVQEHALHPHEIPEVEMQEDCEVVKDRKEPVPGPALTENIDSEKKEEKSEKEENIKWEKKLRVRCKKIVKLKKIETTMSLKNLKK